MGNNLPFFSIIVPTYRRPKRLIQCLQAISGLDYPRERFEVIVVDDEGRIPLGDIIAGFGDRRQVTLLEQPHAGPATARNTGTSHARGEYIAFTDDDCMPAPDWLRALAARFAKAPECAVGGHTVNALSGNLYSTASQMLVDYLFNYYNRDTHRAQFMTANNLAFPVGPFRAIGGFSQAFARAAAEDRELCYRWVRRGHEMVYAPEVRVFHQHHLTFSGFCRQHFTYGQGAHDFHQVRVRNGDGQMQMEPPAFYLGMLRHPFSEGTGPREWGLSFLLGVSQVANVAGFVWERFRSKARRTGP
jgi:cellulose synthase/poly-beta-1,6-N-acetylglucosamine synthase-like glycosyltransferase